MYGHTRITIGKYIPTQLDDGWCNCKTIATKENPNDGARLFSHRPHDARMGETAEQRVDGTRADCNMFASSVPRHLQHSCQWRAWEDCDAAHRQAHTDHGRVPWGCVAGNKVASGGTAGQWKRYA